MPSRYLDECKSLRSKPHGGCVRELARAAPDHRNTTITAANRAFFEGFDADPAFTRGEMLFAIQNAAWSSPTLFLALAKTIADGSPIEAMEFEPQFPGLGARWIRLAARRLERPPPADVRVLLVLNDLTAERLRDHEREDLLQHKDRLLAEMQHRIANSLSIIASILMMKASTASSTETKAHLHEAHQRVMSLATLQKQLSPGDPGHMVKIKAYLTSLCESLSSSMINQDQCEIKTSLSEGLLCAKDALAIGLIVTELVINAIRLAFPNLTSGCEVLVQFEMNGPNWRLRVSDNGTGVDASAWPPARVGLGASIINALATQQLDAKIETTSGATGTTVVVTHATFAPSIL